MGKKAKTEAKKLAPAKISPKSAKISKKSAAPAPKGKVRKAAKKAAAEDVPAVGQLPSVETDVRLKEICDKAAAVEQKESKEEAKAAVEAKAVVEATEAAAAEVSEGAETAQKVKVKRKDALIKKKSTEKSFLSLETPAEDDKNIKLPSYSYKKNRGIVYLNHIPHGFYENQMRDFFSQFGTVTNLRLGRSKKSGKSRGFAFVEFKYSEVAKVVAETMNNYLMFNRIVKAELLSKDKCSPKVFMGKINPYKPPGLVQRRKAKKLHNAVKTELTEQNRLKRITSSMTRRQKQLDAAGINFKIEVS